MGKDGKPLASVRDKTKQESRLQAEVLRYLRSLPQCRAFRVWPTERGLPDVVCCYRGRFYAFELKVSKNKPTPLQEHVLQEIRDAGGVAKIIRSIDEIKEALK
ncbi:MAG: VRR-NUC domain-containing protein [Deltaproteobacteria bacterium]|nr:VRR-NUC domain-containing protein [Deltaproteobacteria bacterium]